jgi:hypothetical protein
MGKTAFSGSDAGNIHAPNRIDAFGGLYDISDNKQPLEHEQHSQHADNNTYNNESYTLKATLMSPFTITVEIWTYYRKH